MVWLEAPENIVVHSRERSPHMRQANEIVALVVEFLLGIQLLHSVGLPDIRVHFGHLGDFCVVLVRVVGIVHQLVLIKLFL